MSAVDAQLLEREAWLEQLVLVARLRELAAGVVGLIAQRASEAT